MAPVDYNDYTTENVKWTMIKRKMRAADTDEDSTSSKEGGKTRNIKIVH